MLNWIEDLPVEFLGTHVLGYLSIKDIVMLERGCGSKQSHQAFQDLIFYYSPVELGNISSLEWFTKKRCVIHSLSIGLPGNNRCLHVKNLRVKYFSLHLFSIITIESLAFLLDNNTGQKLIKFSINGDQNKEVIEQLSVYTRNVSELKINHPSNCKDWLTFDILSRWKLKNIYLSGNSITSSLVLLIVQTCSELISIKLMFSIAVDDAAVISIAEHCPKLKKLVIYSYFSPKLSSTALLALSERGLPLEELKIDYIPNIPTADIARRCSHALSRFRYINTNNLYWSRQDFKIALPYMTGLKTVSLRYYCDYHIPLLTQYCHKLAKIEVHDKEFTVADILSLSRANPLLQELNYLFTRCGITDTVLIELIHVCPHLHTLCLPHETDITDIGILALSEHCPQLQRLTIGRCKQVTEASVLLLLQRCRKLTTLEVSSSSLSEETWTQLDSNTQKRVSRW